MAWFTNRCIAYFRSRTVSVLLFSTLAAADVDCPGVLNVNDNVSQCCVGGTLPPVVRSTCAGWPICTGPVTTTTTDTPVSCATIVQVSDSDYSSVVASLSSSMAASGTKYQTTLNTEGSNVQTDDGSGSAQTGAAPSNTVSAATTWAASLSATPSSSGGSNNANGGTAIANGGGSANANGGTAGASTSSTSSSTGGVGGLMPTAAVGLAGGIFALAML